MKKLLSILLLTCSLMVLAEDIKPVSFTDVKVTDTFWKQRLDLMRKTTIRYAFQKCDDAGQIRNFLYAGKIVSGEVEQGSLTFQSGQPYDDAEVYKVIEGASYLLTVEKDTQLEQYVDSIVDIICSAQEPDGYLQTNFTIHNPLHAWYNGEKWTSDWNLSHETFNVGELIEAGIAYYQATGKDKLLNCAKRAADNMLTVFNENGIRMAPGHAVVELALVRLYELTGEEKYLQECKFFLDCRGIRQFDASSNDQRVNGKYWQDHLPAIQQRTAEGHAVRAMYFYSGMADWVRYSGDTDYQTAIDAIWNNIASKKFYITGGFGARDNNESFGDDYELPNSTAYCETCASVAGCMFCLRMFRLHGDSRYIDMLERALYNTVLDGYGITGKTFYYPNRLEASSRGLARSEWFGTSCCPTNLSRLIPSVPGYVLATTSKDLYVNLYMTSTSQATIGENKITLAQKTLYPYGGTITLTLSDIEGDGHFTLRPRIPGWAVNRPVDSDLYSYTNPTTTPVTISVNGEEIEYTTDKGYAVLERDWKAGDVVTIELPMDVHQVISNENLKTNKGLCSYERGPIVYCAEAVDNGSSLDTLYIPQNTTYTLSTVANIYSLFKGNVRSIRAKGNKSITLIPFYTHASRSNTQMKVWIPTDKDGTVKPLVFLDEVKCCNTTSETAHNLQGSNMRTGTDLGWRDAPNGYIQYDMTVKPDQPMEFITKQWGSDNGNRHYNIYCDGTLFSYDEVNNFAPNEYYYMRHPIPYELTKGKEKVTIKMQSASSDDVVGGIYGAYTAVVQDTPDGIVTVDDMWPNKNTSRTLHAYTSNGTTGTLRTRTWLDGSGTVGQRWRMAVDSTHRNYLMILYWGGETDTRNFDIYCDNVLVGSESLLQNDPGRYYWGCYMIPEEATSGKTKVTVHLTSSTGTKTGGVFYAYTLASTSDSEDAITLPQASSESAPIQTYDLEGRKLSAPRKGVNIVGVNGSFKKIVY